MIPNSTLGCTYDASSNKLITIEVYSIMEFSSRQLRAFVMTAQHQSFSRAAEALFITPSGLSVLIRELENQLGFRLFDRTTRHVSLTTPGEQLLRVVRRDLADIDAAISSIGQTARKESHMISVGDSLRQHV